MTELNDGIVPEQTSEEESESSVLDESRDLMQNGKLSSIVTPDGRKRSITTHNEARSPSMGSNLTLTRQ